MPSGEYPRCVAWATTRPKDSAMGTSRERLLSGLKSLQQLRENVVGVGGRLVPERTGPCPTANSGRAKQYLSYTVSSMTARALQPSLSRRVRHVAQRVANAMRRAAQTVVIRAPSPMRRDRCWRMGSLRSVRRCTQPPHQQPGQFETQIHVASRSRRQATCSSTSIGQGGENTARRLLGCGSAGRGPRTLRRRVTPNPSTKKRSRHIRLMLRWRRAELVHPVIGWRSRKRKS